MGFSGFSPAAALISLVVQSTNSRLCPFSSLSFCWNLRTVCHRYTFQDAAFILNRVFNSIRGCCTIKQTDLTGDYFTLNLKGVNQLQLLNFSVSLKSLVVMTSSFSIFHMSLFYPEARSLGPASFLSILCQCVLLRTEIVT